jgi:hypothetical protein
VRKTFKEGIISRRDKRWGWKEKRVEKGRE